MEITQPSLETLIELLDGTEKHRKDLEQEVKFLVERMRPLLDTYEKEYEEHEMPHGFPTPDTYHIVIDRIRKLIS